MNLCSTIFCFSFWSIFVSAFDAKLEIFIIVTVVVIIVYRYLPDF